MSWAVWSWWVKVDDLLDEGLVSGDFVDEVGKGIT